MSGAGREVFTDEAQFLRAVRPLSVESFETFSTDECSAGGPTPLTTLVSPTFSVTTQPLAGGTSFLCTGNAQGGPHPIDGDNMIVAGSNSGDPWRLTFTLVHGAPPVFAVGFYVTDAAEQGDLIVTTDDGQDIVVAVCCRGEGNELFFGFVTQKRIRGFQVTSTGGLDGAGFDRVTLAFKGKGKQGPQWRHSL